MTPQEKLSAVRAEIERLYSNHVAMDSMEGISTTKQLNHLLTFINFLPEESKNNDLEEEIAQYFTTKFGFERKDKTLEIDKLSINSEDLLHIARHFAKWGKMQVLYPVSPNLEEASTEYAEKAYSHPIDRNVGKADFIMGAQWQMQKDKEMLIAANLCGVEEGKKQIKQQMMKDAIEADVRVDVPVNDGYVYVRAYVKKEKLKVGDKVKLIIIKED